MAPALVEHSAQERNSSSKYLEKLSRIPPIVLVDSIKHIESKKLLTSKLFSAVMVSEKERLVEKENSHLTHNPVQSTIPQTCTKKCFTTTESECLSSKLSSKLIPITSETNEIVLFNRPCETVSLTKPISNDATPTINSSLLSTVTDEKRTEQPVAKYDKKELYSLITQRQDKILSKNSDINQSYSILNSKVKQFRLHNAYSHMNTNLKGGDIVSSSKQVASSNNGKMKVSKESGKKMKISPKLSRQRLCESNLQLSPMYDSLKYLSDGDTDHEENFDSRVKIPVSRGKRKSDKHLPTTADLHQWKESRSYVGSQCSWLSLRIDTLDKKIASLHKVYKKTKTERQASRTIDFDQLPEKVKIDQETVKYNSVSTSSATSHSSQDEISSGSSRTCLMKGTWCHKYIKKPDIKPPCDQFKCRNSTAIYPCQSCLLTLKETKGVCHDVQSLDASFHERLSYKTDTSLPLLLEKTLREEKINTKVTITKPTKKKKKLKLKETTASAGQQRGSPSNSKIPHKNEKRSDEIRRKRSSTEGSGRVRKIRKFSDSFSYDSSKPSTPTNELISPLSQSLNASAGFKNKKKSSGDYDINNIVIPYSMAASTRVERIQYKEIPTPGWRNIDFDFDERNRDEDAEHTDDESFMERHARCEILERKRFTNFFHLSMNRRRPRTSEGPNSQPPSPLVIDDVCVSNAGTPADSPNGLNTSKNTSVNIQSYTEEERDPPWASRNFPLENEDFIQLSTPNTSENVHERRSQRLSSLSVHESNTLASLTQVSQKLMETSSNASNTPMASPLLTPSSSFSSPSTPAEANSNWTVKVVDDKPVDVVTPDRLRKGIVLKLAKK